MTLIPPEYRLLARVVGILIVLALVAAAGALGGARVATWKAEAACATSTQALRDQVTTLKDQKRALELAIAEVNQAAAVAQAQTQAAEEAQRQAQQHAAELAAFSQSRMDKLEASFKTATSCDGVLKSYWELRK